MAVYEGGSGQDKGKCFKLRQRRLRLVITRKLFTQRVVMHWNVCFRVTSRRICSVIVPSTEVRLTWWSFPILNDGCAFLLTRDFT